jgi:SAM-dependent methyltransferase
MTTIDTDLASKYGAYASFASPADPDHIDDHGDSHVEEVTRLLTRLITPDTVVLDLGCGGGQRMCGFAPSARHIWGLDMDRMLLDGARERAATMGLSNVTFVQGNSTNGETITELPGAAFDLVYTVRGPFINASMLPKLKPNAQIFVEWYRDPLGLKEIFGRRTIVPNTVLNDADACISHHLNLSFVPVSVKEHFFEQYYRDEEHLAVYLKTGMTLSNWWMEHRPFDPDVDTDALKLYARYNRTERGIRVLAHRKLYLFRRTVTDYYAVDGIPE